MGPFGAMGYGPCGMSTGAGLQGVASVAIPFKKVIERKELHKHLKSFLILHGNSGNCGNRRAHHREVSLPRSMRFTAKRN